MSTSPQLRVAVDIGGTFTDMAAFDEATGQLLFGKALSTHGQLVNGIQATLDSASIDLKDGNLFLHGSTIAINTLLERNGANTALLITEGFRDIYEIGRVNRPDAYNLFFNKHQPLVKRSLRFEVAERLRADGSTHKPLDEAAVRELAKELDLPIADSMRFRSAANLARNELSSVLEKVRKIERSDALVDYMLANTDWVARLRAEHADEIEIMCLVELAFLQEGVTEIALLARHFLGVHQKVVGHHLADNAFRACFQ